MIILTLPDYLAKMHTSISDNNVEEKQSSDTTNLVERQTQQM